MRELTGVAEEKCFEGHLLKYTCESYRGPFEAISIYKLILKFDEEGGKEVEDFIKYAVASGKNSLYTEADKLSRTQTQSPLWHQLRFGRITASKYQLAHCQTPDGTLGETIIGGL